MISKNAIRSIISVHGKGARLGRFSIAFCTLCMVSWGLEALPEVRAADDGARPNVVVILADDLGSGDLGCYNPETKIKTPSFSKIAAEGMRFTDAHTPSAVCSPTRYGVLTGRYAWRSRLKKGVLWGYSKCLIEEDRATVASVLQQQGYATACFGKWHLGFQKPDLTAADLPPAESVLPKDHAHAVDYTQPLTPGPNTVGFDYFFGIPASLDMDPYLFVENDRPVEPLTQTVAASKHRRQGGEGMWRGGDISASFKHEDVLPRISEVACQWIRDQTQEKPFFVYFPLTAPHTPWVPTEEFKGTSLAGYYGDFVTQVDSVVGNVLNALDEAGHAENTLLIVTSDNGSHWPEEDIEKWQHRANLHYRGQKADIWEGGHRVPFLVRWPGHVAPNSVNDSTICLTDIFATVTAAVGVEIPEAAAEDSFNLVPLLLDASAKGERPAVVHHSAQGTFALRSGDWKLIPNNLGSGGFTAPRQVQPEADGPQGQLYNLKQDPSEQTNVWSQHPEVVERMQRELHRLQTAGRSRAVSERNNFATDELVAWCIVPFDAAKRGPAERAQMVQDLGLKRVAYDWRGEHVATFEEEILEYKKQGLDFFAFWSWHEDFAPLVSKHHIHPQFWLTNPSPEGKSQSEKVAAAAKQLMPIVKRASALDCRVGLYNHGGWGGQPENLVAVCEFLRNEHAADHVGIVYNFHHGHEHISDFEQQFSLMQPYLLCLNLNGMAEPSTVKGMTNKILDIGSGKFDKELLQVVRSAGYDGPVGILDHRNELDAKDSLQRNLSGLQSLLKD